MLVRACARTCLHACFRVRSCAGRVRVHACAYADTCGCALRTCAGLVHVRVGVGVLNVHMHVRVCALVYVLVNACVRARLGARRI